MSKNRKTTKNRNNRNTKSLKGKWGKIGAPPKAVKFPSRAFTMQQLFDRNPKVCELTVRTRVTDCENGVAEPALVRLPDRKQKGGSVGRPKAVYILKSLWTKDMGVYEAKEKSKPATATVSTPAVTITAPPVATPTPATSAPVVETAPASPPAPVEVTPVVEVAPASPEPAPVASTPEPAAVPSEPVVG